jgi:hypothetical protein
MNRRVEPVSEALDGATGDYAVSGDAMRWSHELAETPSSASLAELPGIEAAVGLGSVLGLDAGGVRRLVTGAFLTLTSAATDVVTELRQLTRGASGEPEPPAEE